MDGWTDGWRAGWPGDGEGCVTASVMNLASSGGPYNKKLGDAILAAASAPTRGKIFSESAEQWLVGS